MITTRWGVGSVIDALPDPISGDSSASVPAGFRVMLSLAHYT